MKLFYNSSFRLWLRFAAYLKPHLLMGFILLILLLIGNLSGLVSPFFLKIIIDQVFPNKDYSLLLNILLLLTGIYIIRVVASFFADYLFTWISNKITLAITTSMFDHIIQLPLGYFRINRVGHIVYRINSEVGQVRRAFTGSIINMINNVMTIVGLIVLMSFLELRLFVVILLLYPLLVFVLNRFGPWIKKIAEKTRMEESDILAHLTERFNVIKSIKLLNGFKYESNLMKTKMYNLVETNQRATILTSGASTISIFLLLSIPLIVLAYGGKLVLENTITVGTLIAFLQYTNKLHEPFKSIVNIYNDLVKTTVSIKRIFEILDEPFQSPDIERKPVSRPIKKIIFENVSFCHNGKVILSSVNLSMCAGKSYAIVGPSGAGKTSLIDLLFKFITPTAGDIWINDINLSNIDFSEWMECVSACGQGYPLLKDNVRDNIRYGNPYLPEEDIDRVVRRFDIFSNNNSSHHLSATVGEFGSLLSGGQRQKISIARTVLRRPEILAFDEATSEIDSHGEGQIFESLFQNKEFNILILVSHRLSSLRHVDEIIYVEQGRVLELGTFDELIQRQGLFYSLFKNQIHI